MHHHEPRRVSFPLLMALLLALFLAACVVSNRHDQAAVIPFTFHIDGVGSTR